ncbi:hypothetical protein [Pantanalinema sp. GBBB05]|uniref:hypothetical protein n=1 Tax=Pantanalinema sp. GBBB05 TaxID=2604139 RepID=UPI001D1ABAAC|nr:hypothetical protein [Pantanalinema sp. GBBB05]
MTVDSAIAALRTITSHNLIAAHHSRIVTVALRLIRSHNSIAVRDRSIAAHGIRRVTWSNRPVSPEIPSNVSHMVPTSKRDSSPPSPPPFSFSPSSSSSPSPSLSPASTRSYRYPVP